MLSDYDKMEKNCAAVEQCECVWGRCNQFGIVKIAVVPINTRIHAENLSNNTINNGNAYDRDRRIRISNAQ